MAPEEYCGCWPGLSFKLLSNQGKTNEDKPGRPDPADFTIADEDGATKFKLPGSIDGQQFIIKNCKNTQVFLFDHSATITVDDCENCKFVFGPIKGSVFFRNCKSCQSIVACQQFRSRDCIKLDTFLCCTSQPIIESSSGMKFGCFQYSYPELAGQFQKSGLSIFNNNWSNIHDFTPVPAETNWSLVPEDCSVENYVPLPTVPELSVASTSPEDSVVPVTRGSRPKNFDESILLVFFGSGKRKCADFLRELKEKGSCDIMQTKEIPMSADEAKRIFQRNENSPHVERTYDSPVIGVELNGEECVYQSLLTMKKMEIAESELYVSSRNNEEAKADIDAFFNFVDMSMN
eukprot:gene16895-18601_t